VTRATADVEPYESRSVAPYGGSHDAVYAHIDAHLDAHVEHVRRWVRQPSVSSEGVGISEMAELLRGDLEALGFRPELAPTGGHPGVIGHYDAGAARTLVVYMMYDVQPADPAEWRVPPFEGRLVDHELGTVLVGRGVLDQKGPERALLNAVESILAVEGTLPVNLLVVAEGEEELGSPHYDEILDRCEDRLRAADGVLMPFLGQDASGQVMLSLGVKGLLYFELEARGDTRRGPAEDIVSSLKVLVDAPVWRLVHALASLTTDDGNTFAVPGCDAAVRPPTADERRLLAGMLPEWEAREGVLKAQYGIGRWIDDVRGEQSLVPYLFSTALNIDGIAAGWTGPGVKTVLPHVATAKLDLRLVPDQDPDEVVALVRRHLDDRGFDDVELRVLAAYPAAQVAVDASIVQAMIGVLNKWGHPPAVAVRSSGSAPWHPFTKRLGLPLVSGGLGHGSGAHAVDELMVITPAPGSGVAGLADVEKAYVDFLHAFAATS
jgi:acetylornithine deacetylase/succinyl-diaminopimelate desuccinylase-like protein